MTKVQRGSSPAKALPTGTVTFLFTDIEGSTALVQQLGAPAYRAVLELHHRLLRAAFTAHGGVERGTEGDSFFVVFREAGSAVAAAADAQRALATADWGDVDRSGPVLVRMGLHSGQGIRGGDDYVGLDVHRAARIASAAHGGQVLVSESTWALTHRSLPDDVELRDLGEHRLRGLGEPEPIYQLSIAGLPSDFSALRTEPIAASHLPVRATSFVGRETDLDQLRRLVAASRLVTLVGPGGTGKTSLATECARERSAAFREGAWFVALDPVTDPEAVASAIVGALDLRDTTGRPALERLTENLADRSLVLVLDNFEHVLPAAALVRQLLAATMSVCFIVTSRAPLHLSAEQVFPVSPLPVPADPSTVDGSGLDELLAVPSVRLLVDRVAQVQPSFKLTNENAAAIAEICARLDGLPLAIELAAARLPLLGAAGIRDRLAHRLALPAAPGVDVPARQRTLQETIAWSYELLDQPARRLFARLSVFAGGCRLEEAETVCGPAAELGADVLETIGVLVDHSLVTAREDSGGHIRYDMLQTIHEFAVDRLGADERAALARRHALAYLSLAEASTAALMRRAPGSKLDRIAPDGENFRVAMRWSLDAQDAEMALRLATAIATIWGQAPWGIASDIVDGRTIVLAALDLPGADAPTSFRMRALEAAGTAYYYGGDNARAGDLYRAQLELAEELGDRKGSADARFNLLFTEDWRDRWAEELDRIDELDASYRAIGDDLGLARAMWPRATALFAMGRLEEASALLQEAIERFRELHDVAYESMAASSLGIAAQQMGDRLAAARWLLRVMVIGSSYRANDTAATTLVLPLEAIAAMDLDRPEDAATILGASETLTTRYGVRPPVPLVDVIDGIDAAGLARAALGSSAFEAAKQRGREMSQPEILELVLAMAREVGVTA